MVEALARCRRPQFYRLGVHGAAVAFLESRVLLPGHRIQPWSATAAWERVFDPNLTSPWNAGSPRSRGRLAPVLFVSRDQPLNPLTGTDNNGDTILNDRRAGHPQQRADVGLRKIDLGIVREIRTTRGAIEVRADVFSVLNTVNYSGFFNFGAGGVRFDETGTPSFQPTFGQPGAQFQFQIGIGSDTPHRQMRTRAAAATLRSTVAPLC